MEWTDELAEQLWNGSEAAYEELVRVEWTKAVRTAWFILHNVHDAEETAQDAFLSFYQNRRQVRDPKRLRAWFYRILLNAARQQMRRRRQLVPLDDEVLADTVYTVDPMPRVDDAITLRAALQQLPQEEQSALVLCYFTGLKDTDGATAAGWNLGKYKYRLASGRRHLAQLMGQQMTMRFPKEGLPHA